MTGIKQLKRQFKVGALTDGKLAIMFDIATNANLAWDFLLTINVLRSIKPDPAMYVRAIELVGFDFKAQTTRVVMFTVHHDLEAAKVQSMTTCFVKH